MGIFNSIKKSRRESSDIDEKIEYLNKELDKNGLREGMVTSKVYVGANQIPNALHTDFAGQGFGGKSLGYSGSDNVEIGGAKIGDVVASEVGLSPGVPSHDAILNLSGVAQSPINPNTGQRTIAYTRTGMVQMSPARPGQDQGTQGNTTGSIVWYWDATANNPNGTQGAWRQLQFFPGSEGDGYWAVWGSSFLGFTIPRPDLVPAEISGIFSNIGLTSKGNIGTPQTTVLTQNSLGDVAFLPLNTNLSRQGYDYLKERSKRRGTGFINYKRNQKQKLNEPPTKSPKEVRSDRVKQLKSEGDNIGANQFYTKDRIKELEGKDSLTYREESELIGLKEYSEWINTFDSSKNYQPVSDQQKTFDTQAVEENQSFNNEFQNNSNEIASEIATYVEKTTNLSKEEKKAFTEIANDIRNGENINNVISNNLLSSSSSTPQTTPEPPSGGATNVEKGAHEFPDGTTGSQTSYTDQNGDTQRLYYNDKGESVDASGRNAKEAMKLADKGKDGNNAAVGIGVVTGSVAKHTPSKEEISQYIANITPEMIASGEIQVNSERVPYTDGNFQITYDSNGKRVFTSNRDADGNQGANFPDNSFDSNNSSSMTNYGKPIQQVVYPTDGSEPYLLFEKYSYHNKQSTDKSEIPDPWSQFGSDAAHLLGKVFEPINEYLFRGAFGAGNKVPQHVKDMGIHGMAHTEQKIPLSELSDDFKEALEQTNEYSEWNDANNDRNTAERFPPPGQEAEYTNEDGGKVKYYNKGMKTSADGSKYMEILILPWIQPEGGGDGYYGSLWSPGSYTTKIPLGGAKTRLRGAGKEVYTPKPEPKPKPQGGFGGGQGNPTNRRGSGARREDTQYQSKGKLLSEAAKLGHFDPEVLNVDINDIRKGIMPEFPKDPPPEMVDGYSEKSKLAPKKEEGNSDPFINVTKKDLAKNHMLKDSEIKKFMEEIDSINKYIKENPSELIYAQQRYPKDDMRLAQLNWQMDQMLDASKEYMDKTFPENKKLFKKIQKSIKKNIELTDPKSFKDIEVPKFEGVDLTDFKRRKEVVARHYKKAIKIERLFSNKKRRNSIREEREYLNNQSENNTLKEFMTTTGMYFATQENPAIPAVTAPVPDSTGVLGSGFTPPIGGNGDANDPSNYPAAYDTAWMYNSNDVDGETNRPIVKTMDQSVIATYNAANPENSRFPSGGAGIVFGPRGFGTGVGYASGGHYIGVLSPGLFGDGSTKMVPPGSPFGAPWFGMGGMYFPATPELAGVIMSMTGAYMDAGAYNTDSSATMPIQLWAPHSTFHDGQWDDQGTQKYISNTGNRYVLRTFYMYKTGNDYVKEPAVPVTTTVLYRDDLGNPDYLPINIDLGDISDQGFKYLEDKAIAKKYKTEDEMWDAMSDFLQNTAGQDPAEDPFSRKGTGMDDRWIGPPVDKVDASGGLGAQPGDQLAFASDTNDDAARTAYIKSGGLFPWSYLDPIQKDYWRSKVAKDSDSLESQSQSQSQSQAPVDPPVYIDASKITSDDISDEFEDDEKPSAKGVKLTKWISRTDFMKKYPDSSMSEYLDALPYGATDFMTRNPNYNDAWDVNTKGFEDYFLKGDLSALGNNKGTPKPRHSEATPDPEPTKKSSIFTDAVTKLGNFATDPLQAVADFFGNYLTPPAAEYSTNIAKSIAVNKPITVKQEDIPKGDIKKFFKNFNAGVSLPIVSGKPVPYADDNFYADEKGNIKSNIGPNGEKGFYKKNNTGDMGGGKGFMGYGNPLAAAGQAQTQFVEPDDGSEPYFLYTDHAYHNLTSDDPGEVPDKVKATLSSALHALTGKSDATKPNTGAMSGYPPNIKGDVKTEFKIPYSKLPQNIKDRVDNERKYQELVKAGKLKNIDDPYQPESFYVSKKKPDGKLLSEEAMLGFFEPEQLNVNIEDLRKGIMPEFPKEAPPELINGYSSKSRLAPKKLERSSFIKITKKDLAKNHKLKDSEIKQFMDRINAVNDFIKKHPEELVYAQTRYPKSDPRLAQLNWEMDQKLNASKQFMDKHYPENQRLFTKIQKSIKKNVELTDPKSFKGVKTPKFKGVDLTDFKRRKAVVSRHFKKAIRKNKK